MTRWGAYRGGGRSRAAGLRVGEPESLCVVIPGEPVAQGRPRAFYRQGVGVRAYDPAKSRAWKAAAKVYYLAAMVRAGIRPPAFPGGPVEMHVLAVFACPPSTWRKRTPLPMRPKDSTPDAENVAKAVMDAGTGLLYLDDAQVARLVLEKVVGAQGEAPRVEVTVRQWTGGGIA